MPWLNSAPQDEETYTLANNLWCLESYSLFSQIHLKTTLEKPFPLSFVLQGREGDEDVSEPDWTFWIFARNSKALACSLYIICILLYINWKRIAQLAGTKACDLQDLGSSPRSCINSILFFYNWFRAGLMWTFTIHTQSSSPTRPAAYKSRV